MDVAKRNRGRAPKGVDRLALADEQLVRQATESASEAERKAQLDRAANERFHELADAWRKVGGSAGEPFSWTPWINRICKFCATAKAVYADEPIDWMSNIDRVLGSIDAPAGDLDALRFIRAGFAGGKSSVQAKLTEFCESNNRAWAATFQSMGSEGLLHYILDPGPLEHWRAAERAELARAATIEDTRPLDERPRDLDACPPIELLSELSRTEQKIVTALWPDKAIPEWSLIGRIYDGPGTDDRMRVAVSRLSKKLLDKLRGFDRDIQRENGFVKLKML
jgi:hypothetical protein